MICTRDCFNCLFPDCINDEETTAEIEAAERRDAEIQAAWCHHEKELRRWRKYREAHREESRAAAHAHYMANRDYYRRKHAEWYKAKRDQILAQQKAYRDANKEKISARNKEKYRKKKEAAQVQTGTAPDRGNDHTPIVTSCPVPVKGAG